MLVNGITLEFAPPGEAPTFTLLKDLKEVPDIGGDPEMVENSRLNAKYKQYEIGVGDAGDMVYKFVFANTAASDYRKLRPLADAGSLVKFKHNLPDGTIFAFDALISLKVISAGGLNTPIAFDMSCALQSDIVITDPA